MFTSSARRSNIDQLIIKMIKPRFAEIDESELARLIDCSTSDNAKKVINMAVEVLSAYYCLLINITMEYIEVLLLCRY